MGHGIHEQDATMTVYFARRADGAIKIG